MDLTNKLTIPRNNANQIEDCIIGEVKDEATNNQQDSFIVVLDVEADLVRDLPKSILR